MASTPISQILVVGAGAKAAAIVARVAAWRAVLARRGQSVAVVPQLEIIERHAPGAAWAGQNGFSDGTLQLCNAGEKDVGFPYPSEGDPELPAQVGLEIARYYSWFAFLVATGTHAAWVHRGRPFPSHAQWARYIVWVFERAGQKVIKAEVTVIAPALGHAAPQWRVGFRTAAGVSSTQADAVVLTGSGPAIGLPGTARLADGVVDAETFWLRSTTERISAMTEGDIVVIGSGGAAGTILAQLASRRLAAEVGIISLSPLGALFPRGDGFAERRLSSDPEGWRLLPEDVRRDILARTDSGVVSSRIKDVVDGSERIVFQHGRAVSVNLPSANSDELELRYTLGGVAGTIRAKVVVAAMGFDAWGLLRLLGSAAARLTVPRNDDDAAFRRMVEARFGPDLCVPACAGLGPSLHVPALAALAQGPGFASLGSLGMTASAIIDPFVWNWG